MSKDLIVNGNGMINSSSNEEKLSLGEILTAEFNQPEPLGAMFPKLMEELADIPSPNGICQVCEACPQGAITFDSKVIEFRYEGQVKGCSDPLHSVSEIAERMNIHPAAIPLHMYDINRPVYSIGDELYVALDDLKYLIEVHGVLPCIMRG